MVTPSKILNYVHVYADVGGSTISLLAHEGADLGQRCCKTVADLKCLDSLGKKKKKE